MLDCFKFHIGDTEPNEIAPSQPFGNGYLQEFKAFVLPFQKLEKELGLQRERQRDPGLFQVPRASLMYTN